ncbi:glycosyltransferase family 1 protein [Pseudoalteromonas phenolica]|uniref:glycosyltransferase family 1 protein n=1 Tax=Pseudoalteromonas phenolica TaxID=161398 RepID=UPI00384CE284
MRFVVFAEDWGSHPSSTQHLFTRIAKEHDVIWFNSIGMRKPRLNLKDMNRIVTKLSLMIKDKFIHASKTHDKANQVDTSHSPKVQNPLVLPWHDNTLCSAFNSFKINQLIDTSNEEPIIYWLSVATAINAIKLRPQDKLIYYCGDDFSSLAGVDHQMVEAFEKGLIEKADRIFVISDKLMRKMPAHKTQLLEHGVDFNLFNQPKPKANELLGKNNVIGFYGSISSWLDIDLLEYCARQRPEYQFVLVGKAEVDISKLLCLNNVTHHQAIDHKKLAGFSQHWQASILPFKDNGQIQSCDPLKLKEYLAAGVPIVATDFPAVRRFQDAVLISNSAEGFLNRLDIAVAINHFPQIAWKSHSSDLVKRHSWDHKAQFVLSECKNFHTNPLN